MDGQKMLTRAAERIESLRAVRVRVRVRVGGEVEGEEEEGKEREKGRRKGRRERERSGRHQSAKGHLFKGLP